MIFRRRRKGDKKKDQEDSSENPQVGPNEAPEDDPDPDNPEGENPDEDFSHDPADYRSDTGYPRWPGRGRGSGQRGGFNNNKPRTGPTKSDAGWDKPEPGKDGTSTEYGTANSESLVKKRTTSTSSTSSYTQGVSKLFEQMKTDAAQGESFKIPKINKPPADKPSEGVNKPTSGKPKPTAGPGDKNQPGAADAIKMLKAKERQGRDKSRDKNKGSGSRSGSHSSQKSDASAKRGRSSSAGAEKKKSKKKEK